MDLYYDQDESNPVFDVIGESQPLSRPLHSRQSKTALQTTHFSSRLCTLKFWGNAPPTESSNHSQALARAVRNKPQYHSLVLKFVIELSIEIPFIHTDDVKAIDGGIRSEGQSMEVRQGWWHDQEVALKTVRAGRIPDWTDRFNDDKKSTYRKIVKDLIYEIRAMSHKTLRAHRNIVTLLAVGFEPRYINNTARYPIETTSSPSIEAFSPILVLPWALSPLDSFWKTGELDHPHEAAEIVSDIADGLEALHKHDIVHSDLKPGNVLLFRDPSNPKKLVAKLTDFGAVSSKQNNRAPGGLTTRWAAPECFRDSLGAPTEYEFDLGPARDVFSFGLVAMYVALEGQLREKRPPGGFGEPEIGWDRFVKERCERLDRALTEHYGKKWPTHQRLLERWQSLLQETVIVDPYNRMEPDKLGKVRTMLLGRYFYRTRIPHASTNRSSATHSKVRKKNSTIK
jgi:serine/threonine protein kinase